MRRQIYEFQQCLNRYEGSYDYEKDSTCDDDENQFHGDLQEGLVMMIPFPGINKGQGTILF